MHYAAYCGLAVVGIAKLTDVCRERFRDILECAIEALESYVAVLVHLLQVLRPSIVLRFQIFPNKLSNSAIEKVL